MLLNSSIKFLPGFFKGPPESNDPFGGHYRKEVLNAPIIPITIGTGRELSPTVSLVYQIRARDLALVRRSRAWLGCKASEL